MATRMCQDLRVLEGGEELPAHVVGNDLVFQSKHMQRGDLEGRAVEFLVLLTCAAETSDKDGKAEAEFWLQFLLLKRAQHGYKSCSLTKAQDAIKWTLGRHGFSHSLHALVEPQAVLTLLLSTKAPSLDIRKPPTPQVLGASRSILLLQSFTAGLLHTVRRAQVNELRVFLQQLPQSSRLYPERAAVLTVTVDAQDPERCHEGVSLADLVKASRGRAFQLQFS